MYNGQAPAKTSDNWQFKNLTCSGSLDNATSTTTSTLPVYISTTTSDFYVSKTFTYGEIIFLAFLIPVIFFILVVSIRQFLMNKYK
jgi:hypothetical protein